MEGVRMSEDDIVRKIMQVINDFDKWMGTEFFVIKFK